MASQQVNFDIDQGADFRFDVEVLDIGDHPIDLSDAFIVGQIRRTVSSRHIEAVFTVVPTDLSIGQFAIVLSAADTAALKCDPSHSAHRVITQFAYDIEIHYANNKVSRIMQGILSVSPEVTR